MAISTDFLINLTARMIYYASAGSGTIYTVNELYSYLMDYFDDSTTIDDTIPMTAQTPSAYTLVNGWYINEQYYSSFEYLKEGSINTVGFNAGTYNYGIRVITFAGAYTSAVSTDIGLPVTQATSGDSGRLLDYNNTTQTWWIRVDDTSDAFSNTTYVISVTGGTGTGVISTGTNVTGEAVWTNLYTIGTIQPNTQIYLYQNDTQIPPWWSTGHIDVIVKTKQAGSLIDYGLVTVFARQYSKLYDHFVTDLSAGNRTPIPLATFSDINNSAGYWQMALTDGAAAFTQGEIIQDDSDSTIQGIVTSTTGSAPDTIQYYLYNPTQTNFANGTGSFTGAASGSSATAVDPTSVGPAALSPAITISSFGAISRDLNNNNGLRPYDVEIDLNTNTLADLYQYLKFITRYGSAASLNGHTGQDYTAVGDVYLDYESLSGSFTQGNVVTGGTSGATGIIVSDHLTQGALVVRDVAGTFAAGETISEGAASATISAGGVDTINPSKQSPFGTFAGGTFFGARGVWITDYQATQANDFELVDSTGTRQVPPATIAITVSGLQNGDRVSVFQTTGDNEIINRQMYTSHASNNGVGDSTFEVQETIEDDTPAAGTLRVVDNSLNKETRYTYTAWTNSPSPQFTGLSPTLITTYEGTDKAYVPFIDVTASSSSVSVSVTYAADRNILTVVRIAGVQPFKIKGLVNNGGYSTTAIRNPDSVYQ